MVASWEDPSDGGNLDIPNGTLVDKTIWDYIRNNLLLLGGAAGPQSISHVNEIKGWPPVVAPDADLDALNLWWDKLGTPTTAPTVVDVAGEGITETYELAMKVVAAAGSDGLYQRYTYADEPRVKSGRTLSALLAVWVATAGRTLTAKLNNSDDSNVSATTSTTGQWVILAVENLTLAGTYVDLQVYLDGAGTFYVVPLGVCIGPRAMALPPRPTRWVDSKIEYIVNGVDPGGADYVDVDLTSNTSPLAIQILGVFALRNNTSAGSTLFARRKGDSGHTNSHVVVTAAVTGVVHYQQAAVFLDDGQTFQYKTGQPAGDAESCYFHLVGYEEWA